MFYALSKSKNLASVNLAQTLGFKEVANTARQAGIDVNPEQPSWILGAHAMSPFEVAQLYSTLANDGFEVPPKLIRDVMYPDGVAPHVTPRIQAVAFSDSVINYSRCCGRSWSPEPGFWVSSSGVSAVKWNRQ